MLLKKLTKTKHEDPCPSILWTQIQFLIYMSDKYTQENTKSICQEEQGLVLSLNDLSTHFWFLIFFECFNIVQELSFERLLGRNSFFFSVWFLLVCAIRGYLVQLWSLEYDLLFTSFTLWVKYMSGALPLYLLPTWFWVRCLKNKRQYLIEKLFWPKRISYCCYYLICLVTCLVKGCGSTSQGSLIKTSGVKKRYFVLIVLAVSFIHWLVNGNLLKA